MNVSSDLRSLSSFAGVDDSIYLEVLLDVFVDGHRFHTTGAVVSGADPTLTLDTAVTQGQTVTVAYDNIFTDDLSDLLEDGAGNALGQFSAQDVTNNSALADDDDALWPTLSSHSLTVAEGSTASYTVVLNSQPDADVTVSLTVTGHLTASPTTLTFTTDNWNTAQTVTLTAGTNDGDQNSWQEIIHASTTAGFVIGHVKVLVEDNG